MTFVFPAGRPEHNPSTLWSLQNRLLSEAESRMGPRDTLKQICQPIFRNDGPVIVNTSGLDGAFAALSDNAAGYWPTTVYELSHETVHLLNPMPGFTNWLEEGIAVAFSIEMSSSLTDHPMEPPENSKYAEAHRLVRRLSTPFAEVARMVRAKCGSLRSADIDLLLQLFPGAAKSDLARLTEECQPR